MINFLSVIVLISLLWHTCLSTHECNRTIVGNQMTFICPSTVSNQLLRLHDLTSGQLAIITSFTAAGPGGTAPGPFTSIPPNICLMPNLQTIVFSNNQLGNVDPAGSFASCLSNVVTLDLSDNQITNFPSFMIYNMPNLKNLYFQYNQLTDVPANAFRSISTLEIIDFSYNQLTSIELWTLDVKTRADFSNNNITKITNNNYYTTNLTRTIEQGVLLTGNGPIIDFTDAVYEMYGQCTEVNEWVIQQEGNTSESFFTNKLNYLNFGTTQVQCSCKQYDFLQILRTSFRNTGPYPIVNTTCASTTDDGVEITGLLLVNSSCADPTFDPTSTANFAQVTPRLCKIQNSEEGNITTVIPPIIPPTSNAPPYPHYVTVNMTPGECFFTFSNTTSMSISCTNDTSNNSSSIPASLLTSTYMSSVTQVTFSPIISSLPVYLCSLPSHQIDLSNEAFTTLSDATFPCLDSFTTVKLSNNQITSVNMASGNFKNLTSLDLSSNYLTMLPYTILHPTPTSLRYLDLRNNSIRYIDLFISTLKNITINLDNNPINSSTVINPQNITLGNITNSTAIITFPTGVTIVISDSTAVTYGLCNDFQSLRNFLLNLKSTGATVVLDCTCNSINLKNLYQNNGLDITDNFNCSNSVNTGGEGESENQDGTESFSLLTLASCPNSTTVFQTGLCANQTSLSISTMQTLYTSAPMTSTFAHTNMSNLTSSSTLTTPNTASSASGGTTTNMQITSGSTMNTTYTQATALSTMNTTHTQATASSTMNTTYTQATALSTMNATYTQATALSTMNTTNTQATSGSTMNTTHTQATASSTMNTTYTQATALSTMNTTQITLSASSNTATIATLSSSNMSTATVSSNNMSTATVSSNNMSTATVSSNNMSTATVSSNNMSTATVSSNNMSTATVSSNNMSTATVSSNNMSTATVSSNNMSTATVSSNNMSTATVSSNNMSTATSSALVGNITASSMTVASTMNTTQVTVSATAYTTNTQGTVVSGTDTTHTQATAVTGTNTTYTYTQATAVSSMNTSQMTSMSFSNMTGTSAPNNSSNATSSTLGGNSTNSQVTSVTTMNTTQVTVLLSNNTTIVATLTSSNLSTTTNSSTVVNTTAAGASSSLQGSSNGDDPRRTGLIVGVVLGSIAFLAILAALIVAALLLKKRSKPGAGSNKRINRATPTGQAPQQSLQSRVQPRNLRSVRLAPIAATTSHLPAAPVATVVPPTSSLFLPNNNPNVRTPVRGIPLRPDLSSTSAISSQNPPPIHSVNNPTNTSLTPQRLNIGGDMHH